MTTVKHKICESCTLCRQLQEHQEKLVLYERLSAIGEMAAKLAHDIRNPLTAIGGFARRLLKNGQNGFLNENYLRIIVKEIDRLEKMLNDILSYARLSPPRKIEIDLNRLIKSTVQLFDLEAESKNIIFDINLSPRIPVLQADPDQIERVLVNLLSNAIDALQNDGKIRITTECREDWVVIRIADNGIGISDEDLGKLFDPFFSKKAAGCGLGLTVSSQIITAHHGTISVEKDAPAGATFVVKLPSSD